MKVAVEENPAWARYSRALDRLKAAADRFGLQSDRHPNKVASWAAVKIAQAELIAAADEIEPKYLRP
jgi:hypothetical protein